MSTPARRTERRRGQIVVAALLATTLISTLGATSARAAVVNPELELLSPATDVTLWKYGTRPVYVELGLLVAAMKAPLELRVQRPDYTQPPTLTQILRGPGNQSEARALDPELLNGWQGLKDFFHISFADTGGNVVAERTMPFCPGGHERQRVDDEGPALPSYPGGCYGNPFTKGAVWGIDESWAVPATGYESPRVNVPVGRYVVTASIAPAYADIFGIAPGAGTVQVNARVRKAERAPCHHCGRVLSGGGQTRSTSSVPVVNAPDPATLPDLIALPSWGISVRNGKTRSFLNFGATVWNGGAADLVVEGFRRSSEAVMDAYQYFYSKGEPVGKAAAGTFEFDTTPRHYHWHFLQFARYSLIDAAAMEKVRSRKEAFCLAPTDAIDLTLDNAEWNPGAIGFHTNCGYDNSIWIREVLPLGWGDTYFQGGRSQAFDITDLPNGPYDILVEANPGGLLYELTAENNIELRRVFLRGRPGNRRVVVPPWNGIDTEGGFGRGFFDR